MINWRATAPRPRLSRAHIGQRRAKYGPDDEGPLVQLGRPEPLGPVDKQNGQTLVGAANLNLTPSGIRRQKRK